MYTVLLKQGYNARSYGSYPGASNSTSITAHSWTYGINHAAKLSPWPPTFDDSISQMQPTYTQPQAYSQHPLAYDSEFPRGVSLPRTPDFMTSSFAQRVPVTPYYNQQPQEQPSNQQGAYRVPAPVFTEHGNYAYGGGSRPGYESDYTTAGSLSPPSRPLHHGGYVMPGVQRENLEQGETSYVRYHFAPDQFPGHTMNFSPLLQSGHAGPSNQATSPVWHVAQSWVSYASQDELHVTIILKKISVA
ncbi:hypothetical protein BC826DRAFT_1014628 [Russula brevipes]|nr:hypothetical protein BC826DRAFT_1014628 [Russula brevipes]